MTWCLIKHRDNFTKSLYNSAVNEEVYNWNEKIAKEDI
jgi:hypothetical protein